VLPDTGNAGLDGAVRTVTLLCLAAAAIGLAGVALGLRRERQS
jgi:hypothetical protein